MISIYFCIKIKRMRGTAPCLITDYAINKNQCYFTIDIPACNLNLKLLKFKMLFSNPLLEGYLVKVFPSLISPLELMKILPLRLGRSKSILSFETHCYLTHLTGLSSFIYSG